MPSGRWWPPHWLWRWAVRRVDRWHDSFSIEPGEFKVTETLVFWIDPKYHVSKGHHQGGH